MTTTGPNSPGTLADTAGVGTGTWVSAANAGASDNSYATATVAGMGTIQFHYLKATNFGFAIADTQIDGITVEIERKAKYAGASDYVTDTVLRLVIGGTVSGSDLADTATKWPTTEAYATYGGASNLWGLTPSVADINGSTFGVALSVTVRDAMGKDTVGTSVDHIRITITSSSAGGGGQPITKRFGGIPFIGSQPLQGQQRWIKRVSGLLTPSNEWRPAHGIR